MGVSSTSKRAPSGLDQALTLLDAIQNAQRYEEMLKPLQEAAATADAAYERLGLAGDVVALRQAAFKDAEAAKAARSDADAEATARLSKLDREYSLKTADLRTREQAFNATKEKLTAELKDLERALINRTAAFNEQQAVQNKEKAELAQGQIELERDRTEVAHKFAALKEAFNG
tara:strand:- start:867 stop:1388 length:522 start_codon:yes stop_codon:yes gene_type:complete